MSDKEEKVGFVTKMFNLLGWIASLLIFPIFASFLGFSKPLELLSEYLGAFGGSDFLVFASFVLLGLRIGFGSSRLLSPTFLSFLVGGPLILTALETDAFAVLKELIVRVPYLSSSGLNFIVGVVVIFIGIQLSNKEKSSFASQILLLVVLPLGVLIGLFKADILPTAPPIAISLTEGYATASEATKKALSRIDSRHRDDPKVQDYIEDVVNDTTTKEEDKEKLIQQLQQRIDKLENDKTLNKQVRKENERFKEEIKRLNSRSPNDKWCTGAHQASERVYSYENAVMPAEPCVRDLAVHLASTYEGAYHRSGDRGQPSKAGLKQIAALHTYVSDQWKYVNDPTRTGSDYYSLASRSISLGFAGDCDDFSIVMASLVAAVGGTPRIMFGKCGNGGHAFAEVLIGDSDEWAKMKSLLRKHYGDSSRAFRGHKKDGLYWLSLDWRLGELSCAETGVKEEWRHQ